MTADNIIDQGLIYTRRETMRRIALLAIMALLLCSVTACCGGYEGYRNHHHDAEKRARKSPFPSRKASTIPNRRKSSDSFPWTSRRRSPSGSRIPTGTTSTHCTSQKRPAPRAWMMSKKIRRPESLPYWSHRRGVVYPDGLYMPTRENPLTDAVTAASPEGNFRLGTKAPQDAHEVRGPGRGQ